jgi:hypothetical protein
VDPAWPQELETDHFGLADPALDGQSRRFGDLETYRLARLALDHGGPFVNAPRDKYVADPETNEIATAKLAATAMLNSARSRALRTISRRTPDGPDVPRQQRALLADDAAIVPGDAGRTEDGELVDRQGIGPGVGAWGGKLPLAARSFDWCRCGRPHSFARRIQSVRQPLSASHICHW